MSLSQRFAALAALAAATLFLPLNKATSDPNSDKEPSDSADAPASRSLTRGEILARQALSYRGARYRFGGRTEAGFDCSGLTQTVYRKWGMLIPRTSIAQYKSGIPVPRARMKPGDLVFFKNTYRRGVSHVGIYVGDNQFVHAANRKKGVIVSSLSEPYYANRWAGARRMDLQTASVAKPKQAQ